MSHDIKVKITSHEGFLVVETVNPTADDNFVPYAGTNIGCVLIDTGKHLAMSDEAFELLKTINVSGDAIGEITTWGSDKGQCIGWLGPTRRLVQVAKADCSRDGIIDLKYNKIKNEIPVDAYEAITKLKE